MKRWNQYSGGSNSERVRNLGGRWHSDFKCCSDFKWLAILILAFGFRMDSVFECSEFEPPLYIQIFWTLTFQFPSYFSSYIQPLKSRSILTIPRWMHYQKIREEIKNVMFDKKWVVLLWTYLYFNIGSKATKQVLKTLSRNFHKMWPCIINWCGHFFQFSLFFVFFSNE